MFEIVAPTRLNHCLHRVVELGAALDVVALTRLNRGPRPVVELRAALAIIGTEAEVLTTAQSPKSVNMLDQSVILRTMELAFLALRPFPLNILKDTLQMPAMILGLRLEVKRFPTSMVSPTTALSWIPCSRIVVASKAFPLHTQVPVAINHTRPPILLTDRAPSTKISSLEGQPLGHRATMPSSRNAQGGQASTNHIHRAAPTRMHRRGMEGSWMTS